MARNALRVSGGQIRPVPYAPTSVTYSDVQGGWTDDACPQHDLDCNIDADPLFVDADGPDNTYGTEDDDLHLQAGSPCIDVDNNEAVPSDEFDVDGDGDTTEPTPDLDGYPRTMDGNLDGVDLVDMGAYEYFGDDCNSNDIPDSMELDTDEDRLIDECDNCLDVPNYGSLGTCVEGLTGTCESDAECDTFSGSQDGVCSLNQEDTDGDGEGDACDGDDDNDCVDDDLDTDRLDPTVCQDTENGTGDGCDDCSLGDFGVCPDPSNDGPDDDEDGICVVGDNCDLDNPDQADCDGDGIGDVCEIAYCPSDPACSDCDRNGIPDGCDLADCVDDVFCQDCNFDGVPNACELGRVSTFPTVLSENLTDCATADWRFTGPPDRYYCGLKDDRVTYDFDDTPVLDGFGPDFNVYEVDYGDVEFHRIRVLPLCALSAPRASPCNGGPGARRINSEPRYRHFVGRRPSCSSSEEELNDDRIHCRDDCRRHVHGRAAPVPGAG